jgi:peptidoglycan-associated lipoprotein
MIMKAANSIKLVAVMLVLTYGAVGCKKGGTRVTPLPGSAAGRVGETGPTGPATGGPSTPIAEAPKPVTTTLPTNEGLPPTNLEGWQNWPQDRRVFAEQTVYFDFDKANVKSTEVPKLETVASQMKSTFANKVLLVEGHCDERGTEEYNRALGERRALAVRETLARLGLDPSRVVTITYGEDRPAVPGHNEAAWSKNRRGQLVLLTPPSAPATGGGGTQ